MLQKSASAIAFVIGANEWLRRSRTHVISASERYVAHMRVRNCFDRRLESLPNAESRSSRQVLGCRSPSDHEDARAKRFFRRSGRLPRSAVARMRGDDRLSDEPHRMLPKNPD